MEDIDLRQKYITLIGRRGSGKSEVAKYLVNTYKDSFQNMFVFCPTDFNGYWKNIVGKHRVFDNYNEQWVEKLMAKMRSVNEGKLKTAKDFFNVLLVLDDVMAGVRGHQFQTLDKLASISRHLGITTITLVQYFTSLSPKQRLNSDFIFYGKCNLQSNELLAKEFNLGLDKKTFLKMVEESTDNHSFLVLNNCASNMGDLKEVYGVFKVPEHSITKNNYV